MLTKKQEAAIKMLSAVIKAAVNSSQQRVTCPFNDIMQAVFDDMNDRNQFTSLSELFETHTAACSEVEKMMRASLQREV